MRLLSDSKLFWTLASLVVIADVALTQLIILYVPCTKSQCHLLYLVLTVLRFSY